MPILRNPRHEAFCQAFARGEHRGNATAAYRIAYGREDRHYGSRLQQRAEIIQRCAEIQAEITTMEAVALQHATESLGITKEWVLGELMDNVKAAKKREDGAVVNKALELLGRHVGLFNPAPEAVVNVRMELIDRPPPESREEWLERRRLELLPAPAKINGNGRHHA